MEAKIIVNEDHFQFDRKNTFNFWKTIYGFQILYFYTHVCGNLSPPGIWICWYLESTVKVSNFSIWLPKSGGTRRIMPLEFGQYRNTATSNGRCWILTNLVGILCCRISFFAVWLFLCKPNAEKYFWFFLKKKWFHRKYFTIKTILHQNKRSIKIHTKANWKKVLHLSRVKSFVQKRNQGA